MRSPKASFYPGRLSPPLCIIPEDVDFFITQLHDILESLQATETNIHPVLIKQRTAALSYSDKRLAPHEALVGNDFSETTEIEEEHEDEQSELDEDDQDLSG